MSNWIAGIDVHKRMLAVVMTDVAVEGEYAFERRMVASTPAQLHALAEWLVEHEVDEVVMESTRNTGDPCGRRSSGTGCRDAGHASTPAHARAPSCGTTSGLCVRVVAEIPPIDAAEPSEDRRRSSRDRIPVNHRRGAGVEGRLRSRFDRVEQELARLT